MKTVLVLFFWVTRHPKHKMWELHRYTSIKRRDTLRLNMPPTIGRMKSPPSPPFPRGHPKKQMKRTRIFRNKIRQNINKLERKQPRVQLQGALE